MEDQKTSEVDQESRRNVASRNISNIDWFKSKQTEDNSKKALQSYLTKMNEEYQNEQQGDKIRDDILFRKTKIICTLGKYTRNIEAICKLLRAGCQIFRINMSIINTKEMKELVEWIRTAEKITKTRAGILIDLQGPVIRTCEFRGQPSVHLKAGQEYQILCKRKINGDSTFATVDFKGLSQKLKVNDHIIIDFGAVSLRVVGFEDQDEFLASKQLEGLDIRGSRVVRSNKSSLSFQGQKLGRHELFKKSQIDQSPLMLFNQRVISPCSYENVKINLERGRADTLEMDSEVDNIKLDSVKEQDLQSPERQLNFGTQLEVVEEEKIQEKLQEKKKFKVRFDDVYQASHAEKSRVEKEFFQNALQSKTRFQNKINQHAAASQKIEDVKGLIPRVEESPNKLRSDEDSPEPVRTRGIHKSQTYKLPGMEDQHMNDNDNLDVIDEEQKREFNPNAVVTIESLENKETQEAAKQNSNSKELPTQKSMGAFKTVGSALNMASPQENDLLPPRKGSQRGSQLSIRNRKKKIVKKDRKVIRCQVEFDCEIKPHKPLYFPDFDHKKEFELPLITRKDLLDINKSIKLGVDFISVSYVEGKQDILEVRELLSIKGRHIKILAKIQNRKAMENFAEILEAADGIIIARGYLGLDLSIEDVAFVQQYLINQCNQAGKPVILSTQIMESMVTRLRPTRAEVSDISNAVYHGVDCCLLSSETQTGQFYKEACETMSKICYEAERHIDYESNYNELQRRIFEEKIQLSISEAISNCAVKAAYEIKAKLIIVFTNSGQSAITVAKYRPSCPILAVSASDQSAKQCIISKGIFSLLVGSLIGAESLLDKIKKEAMKRGLIKKGDHVVVTTGINEGLEGSTNLLKILQV